MSFRILTEEEQKRLTPEEQAAYQKQYRNYLARVAFVERIQALAKVRLGQLHPDVSQFHPVMVKCRLKKAELPDKPEKPRFTKVVPVSQFKAAKLPEKPQQPAFTKVVPVSQFKSADLPEKPQQPAFTKVVPVSQFKSADLPEKPQKPAFTKVIPTSKLKTTRIKMPPLTNVSFTVPIPSKPEHLEERSQAVLQKILGGIQG